jgi:hypothetical protein
MAALFGNSGKVLETRGRAKKRRPFSFATDSLCVGAGYAGDSCEAKRCHTRQIAAEAAPTQSTAEAAPTQSAACSQLRGLNPIVALTACFHPS